jgi:hypothetical protein
LEVASVVYVAEAPIVAVYVVTSRLEHKMSWRTSASGTKRIS